MSKQQVEDAHLLIVDDEEPNLLLLEAVLSDAGYGRITSTTDSRKVLPLFLETRPDLLILDLNMPHLDGFAVLRQLAPRIQAGQYFPILIVTAEIGPDAKHEALANGAKDFLTKPLDPVEVILRVRNLLTTRFLHKELQAHNEHLEHEVRARTQKLEQAQLEILTRLALAAEYRDDETGEHTWRVGHVSSMIAKELEWPQAKIELMRRAAPLHDLGKIGIPDKILLKIEKFNAEDFEEMKNHVIIGSKILSGSGSPLLQLAEIIALTHHERWDGSGYMKLRGEEIPMSGRIVTIADVFDALTHKRPYKEAWPVEKAREEIVRQAGKQFDPQVAEVFLKLLDRDGEGLLLNRDRKDLLARLQG